MFFICIVAAILAYALQVTLMASYYRTMDQMSAVAYRGLSLALSMAPILLFVPKADYSSLPQAALPLLLASLLATLGNWANANAFRHLSVGIAEALCMVASTITGVLASYYALGDTLSAAQVALIAALLVCVMLLGLVHSHDHPAAKGKFWIGAVYCLLFGFFLGSAYVGVGAASRQANPLLVGYLWESIIGVIAFLMASARTLWSGRGMEAVSRRDFLKILLYSWPTAIGTGCYAVATTLGPIGLVAAALSTITVASAVLAYFLYGEKLKPVQWGLVFMACALIASIRLFS